LVAGNEVGETDFKPDASVTARVFVSQILIDAPATARAMVTFGDSITDGDGSTVDANHRWPDFLAARFVEAGGAPVGVLNAGISGAKLLKDRMGVNALARFDRDVLSIPGVESVVVMIGINDIGLPGGVLSPTDPPVSIEDLIMGYRQLIAQAHVHNIRVIGVTLTPFEDTFKGVNSALDSGSCRPSINALNWAIRVRSNSIVSRYQGVTLVSVMESCARARASGSSRYCPTTSAVPRACMRPMVIPRPSDGFVQAHESPTVTIPVDTGTPSTTKRR